MKTPRQARHLLLAALLSWAGAVAAQQVTLAPSAVIECLTPQLERRGDIEYPFAELKSAEKGRVKIEARFTVPEGPPELTVLESEGSDAFVSAVKSFMRSWRVPCLPPGGGDARLVQEYVFKPDARKVYWSEVEDRQEPARRQQSSCVRHESGRRAPDYPPLALRRGVQGRVYVRLRFEAADQPPVAQFYARDTAGELQQAVETWVRGYRLPCLTGAPLELDIVYVYRFEGESWGLKPTTLLNLLSLVKGVREQKLQFDTTTMGCPFDLHFTYLRPLAKNRVGMRGSFDPAREPLLRYLADVELDLRRDALDAVYGDSTSVSVPCIKINLNPKENS
jgi:hypothetical protein